MDNFIKLVSESGYFSTIDIHIAKFITRLHGQTDLDIFLGAALVSRAVANGDICLDLAAESEKMLLVGQDGQEALTSPSLSVWRKKLMHSCVVGRPGEFFPLILDKKDRLYFHRYWNYEDKLARSIIKRTSTDVDPIDFITLKKGLRKLFPRENDYRPNWQKIASYCALTKKFCVISGGPGTGKTHLIAKILVLILEQTKGKKLDIFLAAPTGKAAARLKETIRSAKEKIDCTDWIKEAIPTETYTIHRMLKTIPGSPYFKYNEDNPLPADLVVIDEASMVDLALMSKLIQAVPSNARLILVGDKEQLASVEAGSVLGDICDRNNFHGFSIPFCDKAEEITGEKFDPALRGKSTVSGLSDCIITLKKSYRFAETSAIGALSDAVNHADSDKAIRILKDAQHKNLNWEEISSYDEMKVALTKKVREGYGGYLKSDEPVEALKFFKRFIILCATRKGLFGVETVNHLVEDVLYQAGLIKPYHLKFDKWYPGRPVLIIQNSYELKLFNGDIGITLPIQNSFQDDLYVFFSDTDDEIRRFAPFRLPENETAYALTIHKSQGSEFDNVLIIMPDQDSPLLTKELLYTGITRARKSVTIWSHEHILRHAISKSIKRTSGLRDLLWDSK